MLQPPEAQLAYLGFQLISPGRLLGPYVRSYWHFRRDISLVGYHEEYMHPQGRFGIVFNFGDASRLDGQIVSEPVFLDGAITISRKMGFSGHVNLMGVSFHEGGAYPFLGVPLHELRDELTLLDVLDRNDLLQLHAQLYEAASLSMRVVLLEEWLISRLSRGKERSMVIPASLTMLRAGGGQLPIPEVARALGISQRQLERLYRHQVGMTPKHYSQLLRIGAARLSLKYINERSVAGVAADFGFYDQAHFIREFNAVIGMTPYAYMKRSRQH